MTRPRAHGYAAPTSGVLQGMSGTRRKSIAAVTGLVTAGLVLSGCAQTTAGTPISDQATPSPVAMTTAPTTNALPETFEQRVKSSITDVLAWWEPMTDDDYSDLTVHIDTRPDPDCPVDEWAAVCSYKDGSEPELHIDRPSLEPITRPNDPAGNMTLAVFMAHEVGHVVANKAAGHIAPRMVSEQRAECAAGIFIANRGEKYGTTADLKTAYKNRLKVFDVDDNAARDTMTAAFNVGADSITAQDCIRAFPE